MEKRLGSELRENLISECLKWEIELKRLKNGLRVKRKRNLQVKKHNKLLEGKLVVFQKRVLKNGDNQKVIKVKECRVLLKNYENRKENESKKIDSQINIFSENKRFKCQHPGCKKIYDKKFQLNNHMNIHTKKFQCQVCQKCCQSPFHLKIHLRIHTGDSPFECDWAGCGEKFKRNAHLKSHVANKHSDKRSFQCKEDGCGKWFKTNNNLQNHAKLHSSFRFYKCQAEGCDKRFKNKRSLKRHVEFVHNKERLFKCDKKGCGGVFQCQARLNLHAISHSSIRLFQCQECDSNYKYKQDLNEHVLTKHSDSSNDVRCDFDDCGKTFKIPKLLKRHKKLIHKK